MARKRFISSDMGKDEDIVDIAEQNCTSALMWPWFIAAFDDWGRLEITSPKQVKLDVFKNIPVTVQQVIDAIGSYSETGLVFKYIIGSRSYLAIEPCKFYKYQTYIRDRKRTEDNSNYPAPEHPPWENCTDCRASARICIPSPSPSPSPSIERDIGAALRQINDKAMGFGLNSISPEFIQDSEMRLKEGTEPGVIIKALAKAKENASSNKGVCPYAISILQGWAREGIKTMAQWNEKHGPKDKPPPKSKADEKRDAVLRAREIANKRLIEQGVVKPDDTS